MGQSNEHWGKGIPQYHKEDIFTGLELQAYCTNLVARSMERSGYSIRGVVIDHEPTQVVAEKDGKLYAVIVAGACYPEDGRISIRLKKRFAAHCAGQRVTPTFTAVSLRSVDPERAEAGVLLKHDRYEARIRPRETLTGYREPTAADSEYRILCVEKLVAAYCSGHFEDLYADFDADIRLVSQWEPEPVCGSAQVTAWYEEQSRSLQRPGVTCAACAVMTTDKMKKAGNTVLVTEPGILCALVSRTENGKRSWTLVTPKFSDDNRLTTLTLADPALFNFRPCYAFE